ncbi:MAG: MBL fold metallo-hydrolase [Planctomycetota bacterium]
MTNVYAIEASSPDQSITSVVLVDAGKPGNGEAILERFESLGVRRADVTALIITHAHRDHAGSAAELQALLDIPVLVHELDAEEAREGSGSAVRPNGPMAFAGWAFVGGSFPAFEPDRLVTTEMLLTEYGIPGSLVPTPGHTDGSQSVLLETGDAIVGDLLAGSVFSTTSPRVAFYTSADTEDKRRAANAQAEQSLSALIERGAAVLHTGHGGPIDASSRADLKNDG